VASRIPVAFALAGLLSTEAIHAQWPGTAPPNLQGIWNGGTLTPLQRPAEFASKAEFTPEEAAEYVRTRAERSLSRLPTDNDRLQQIDLDATYVEEEAIQLDGRRTSLIVDPPNGMLPPLVPAAQARLAARPKRTFEDPEVFNLAERCLLGNFGLGGSTASPPLLPGVAIAPYFQIVQTDDSVMIFSEWMHDVRVVRVGGIHPPPTLRRWLGDSIGRWEGQTLLIDTTNFRSEVQNMNASEKLHVVERFTRVDANTLRYRVTVDDPDTWSAPWTAEWPFKAVDVRMYEVACHEGNYAIEHFLRGARFEERR
jgi:hypothetical protein